MSADPPVDASPVAENETPTADPTETPTTATDIASPSVPADLGSPTAEPSGTTSEPTATATEPTTLETSTDTPTMSAQTTENQEPRTDVVPVAGVRRSANSANGWTALDGDPATVWRTTDVPPGRLATITLDLGQPVSVAALRILVAEEGFAGALTIEASDDLASWTYLASPTAADLPAGEWATVPFDTPVTTRYVRLVVVNPADVDTLGGAAEIEVLPTAS